MAEKSRGWVRQEMGHLESHGGLVFDFFKRRNIAFCVDWKIILETKLSRVWDRRIKTYLIEKKTTKEATKKQLWNADGELALERKKESFFFFLILPIIGRKEKSAIWMQV